MSANCRQARRLSADALRRPLSACFFSYASTEQRSETANWLVALKDLRLYGRLKPHKGHAELLALPALLQPVGKAKGIIQLKTLKDV